MESLSDTTWDVVISGTGLQPSLLALALSRSGKNIIHVDPNEYYGGLEATFSLQEADEWAAKHSSDDASHAITAAEVRRDAEGPASTRAYALALAPQLVHSRSKLVTQLVDSKAFRQIEFLAVGSFFILQPPSETSSLPTLGRIPSTREEIFTNTAIPTRAKRTLMKFLKFVLSYDSEPQLETWQPHADEPLADFLASEFSLDSTLQSYILTLTLSHDGKLSVKDGLSTISRHLSSMNVFGPGFAAVYPKWGGLSEVAQVGCRAAAVGGAVYMLGSGIESLDSQSEDGESLLTMRLGNNTEVKAKYLVQGASQPASRLRISRLTAVTKADLSSVFELSIEGAPTPAVAVVALPAGSVTLDGGESSPYPIYAMVHSSDTGECPAGQYALYLSTVCGDSSKAFLQKALSATIAAVTTDPEAASCIYQLYYEQSAGPNSLAVDGRVASFSPTSLDLAFNDSVLDPVFEAWKLVMGDDGKDDAYMTFEDREAADEDDPFE